MPRVRPLYSCAGGDRPHERRNRHHVFTSSVFFVFYSSSCNRGNLKFFGRFWTSRTAMVTLFQSSIWHLPSLTSKERGLRLQHIPDPGICAKQIYGRLVCGGWACQTLCQQGTKSCSGSRAPSGFCRPHEMSGLPDSTSRPAISQREITSLLVHELV